MSWQLCAPETPAQWQAYFQLRYQVLREPWGQPIGSERDDLEADAFHQMIVSDSQQVLAVGRLHLLADGRAQVRYMAVSPEAQGQGLGAVVLTALERHADRVGASAIVLHARDNAFGFYRKLGYGFGDVLPPVFGIPHQQMHKLLQLPMTVDEQVLWCQQLQQIWHQTIPLSAYMQLTIAQFDGRELQTTAPLAPNKNLHDTMFAGAIYSLLTLTGWGMVWLQLKAAGLQGDIVLADANIRYVRPVTGQPVAKVRVVDCRGSLADGGRIRQQVRVQLWDNQTLLAEFQGQFAVISHA